MRDRLLLKGNEDSCGLCAQQKPLRHSHYVPAFVFRWLRETSATGHIRFAENPNKRVQDGIKEYLLCADCEAILNSFETPFATKIFHPYFEKSGQTLRYEEWMLKFAVSLAWRTLAFGDYRGKLKIPSDEVENVAAAFAAWKDVLRDERPHPGMYEQHLLPLGQIESSSSPKTPNNINRYFMRAVDTDIAFSAGTSFTYVKLGPFAFFGFLKKSRFKWSGAKLHVRHGSIRPRRFEFPENLMEYLFHRAESYAAISEKISVSQYEKIDAAVMSNLTRVASSDQLKAMRRDAEMFGESAILRRETNK